MTASASKLIEKKNALSGKFPQHNVFYKHCLKYCICDFEKCLFSPTIGKWYIFVLYHSSANFLSSSISPKAFFCWAQKKLNAHVSFFFSTMHTLLKSLLGKFDPKLGIWHQAFPAIKLWVNGSSLNCTHWELFSPDRTTVCLHTAVSSQRLSKSVAGHSVHLSTNYLFTCQSFLFSVLFNKHSSNELNGRLTNQYWSQRCSTQVVKGQMLPKHRREFF